MLLALALGSCSPKAEKKAPPTVDPKILISCEGIGEVKLKDSYADLQKKFGDSVLSEHVNNIAGTFTTLWRNQPGQINVYWVEKEKPFKTIKYIEATDAMAPYLTKDSIGVGMSMRDLVRKNGGMALTFVNFYGDDNPGLIKDYNNGELPKNNPCFEGILEYTGQKPIDVNEFRAFQAQKEVKSFDRILNRIDVVLSTIRIRNDKK